MLNPLTKWVNKISQELNWAELLLRAAEGDEEAYKKLMKEEKKLPEKKRETH